MITTVPMVRQDREEELAYQMLSHAAQAAPIPLMAVLRSLRRAAEDVAREKSSVSDDPDVAYELVRTLSAGAIDALRDSEGGSLSTKEFAEKLGISPETVRTYRKDGQILTWTKDRRNYRIPAWQLHNGRLLPGLQELLGIAQEKEWNADEVISFVLAERDVLGGKRPLDLLREGEISSVVKAARQEGELGA